MNNTWIKVNSIKEILEGVWLVCLAEEHLGSKLQIASIHPNISVVGACFSFDMPEVTHYMQLPELPVE